MIVYFDTSALLKYYIREQGSDEVVTLMNDLDNVYGSIVVMQVEMAASIQKAVRMNSSSSKTASGAWKIFLDDWQSFTRLRVSAGTIERASEIAWKYGLRGDDSLHLTAALLWQETLGMQITFAIFDRELWQASQKTGLEAWPSGFVS